MAYIPVAKHVKKGFLHMGLSDDYNFILFYTGSQEEKYT